MTDDDARAEAERLPGFADMFAGGDDVNDLAIVLMRAWGEADPRSNVARHPASYVATFVDMARAALAWQASRTPVVIPGDPGDLLALIREHHRVEVEMGQPGSPAVLLGHIGDLLRIIDTPSPVVADVDAIARAVTDLADEMDGWQTRPADLVERLRGIALLRGESCENS